MAIKLSDSTYSNLKQAMAVAQAEADQWVGKELIWEDTRAVMGWGERPYKGRKCEVTSALYCEHTGRIRVLVKTAGKKPGTWLDDNDAFHRFYRELFCFKLPEQMP